jgi:hypothetical protein
MGCEDVTCGCLSSAEGGVEAAGVSVGWLEFVVVTCSCLNSVEASDVAAGVVGWPSLRQHAAVCLWWRMV